MEGVSNHILTISFLFAYQLKIEFNGGVMIDAWLEPECEDEVECLEPDFDWDEEREAAIFDFDAYYENYLNSLEKAG